MVSPRQLRVVDELANGSIEEISPSITDSGAVSYPDVERIAEPGDRSPEELLEQLARRELLERAFQEKVYVCPGCQTEGMSYTTVCPSCHSPHAIERELFKHEVCGYLGLEEEEFENADGESVCPNCNALLESSDRLQEQLCYVCQSCDTKTTMAEDALQCRSCEQLYPPDETIEEVLYAYRASSTGERWVTSQLRARELIEDAFAERGYETSVDATVTGESGTEHDVHVYAEDEVMNKRAVADVHSRPTPNEATSLRTASEDLDADAYLVTSEDAVSQSVAEISEDADITILAAAGDQLQRSYEIREDGGSNPSLMQRINSIVDTRH